MNGDQTAPTPPTPAAKSPEHQASGHGRFWPLALGSIGVVFGDIGTSPLYAFREALGQTGETGLTTGSVMGVVSLALWALILVVTVKYVIFLMRADNRGEGGVLSLAALAQAALGKRTTLIFILSCTGAALFYGDAIITPAISVLSAIEGLRSVPALGDHVTLPVVLIASITILVALFSVQFKGTGGMGRFFGPICVVWFLVIATLGVMHIVDQPGVVAAFSPYYAAKFLSHHGVAGLFVLGSVFLTVTGAEALYADMGHFGRWPIQASWLTFVLPALALNYLGQGAMVLNAIAGAHGHPVENADWFFLMAPEAMRAPLVLLATAATIIASQAVITGAYSLTNQAMQLGLLPRMTVKRTSETQAGEIYLPQINLMLAVGVVFLIGIFKTSSSLAHAYGLAVTGTMAVTTSLAFIVVRHRWKWPLAGALALILPLLAVDFVFLGANGLKLLSGGFVPLVLGGAIFVLMATWVRGSELVSAKAANDTPMIEDFLPVVSASRSIYRAAGTAVFLTADPDHAPGALLHNLKHNKVLHQKNLIVSVRTADVPRVSDFERASVEKISEDFTRVSLTYGFMETPNVPKTLAGLRKHGIVFDIMSTSFFVGRRTVVRGANSKLPKLLNDLFIWLTRNAANPTDFFHIPPGRVVEMGAQITI
ncbi:potassium transporter Kup [Phenylobacterium aquaticum]|uniref:potassium transporter Kup n=1 Tax=Phenylobacterium aquaticum TaxID=1763816 RepID=UPI0026EDF5B2|nr:potassium transporter Kup [Phenylobacterium aquaticum]